jgi:hypothetical protein
MQQNETAIESVFMNLSMDAFEDAGAYWAANFISRGVMSLVSYTARARLSSALLQVARWRHQQRLMFGDPLALEPFVEPHRRELGFAHGYIAGYTGETARWLGSVLYAAEAARQDPVDTGHVTRFDQGPHARVTLSCAYYTWLHVRHLAGLARITRQPRLFAWAERWRAYVRGADHRAVTAIACLGFGARRRLRYLGGSRHAALAQVTTTHEAASWPRAAS